MTHLARHLRADFEATYPTEPGALMPVEAGHERRVTVDGIYLALFWWVVIVIGVAAVAAVFEVFA